LNALAYSSVASAGTAEPAPAPVDTSDAAALSNLGKQRLK